MTTTTLEYLSWGLVATALAALRVAAWSSTGLLLGVNRLRAGPAVRVAVAMLVGACLTMLVYAVLAAAGMLGLAVALDAGIAALSLFVERAEVVRLLRAAGHLLLPSHRAGRVVLVATLCLLWLVAIGPPRDGDVMHYHLAHVRQIIAEGRWRQLPVCSYGIPFGWSLTYLPFEWAGVPQVAHLLNAGAWLLSCALCVESMAPLGGAEERGSHLVARWMLWCATLLPVILKAATTAMADSFTILVVAVVVALLMQWPRLGRGGSAALGFAAFSGLTTRYQAAAVAIAVSVLVGIAAARRRKDRPPLVPFLAGALAAAAAAAPFFVANALTLGSPLWPFAGSLFGAARNDPAGATTEAVRHVASLCAASSVAGGWGSAAAAAGRLLLDPSVFPVPALLVVGCLIALALNVGSTRRVGFFILVFIGAWVTAQPTLAPRFSIYLIAAAVVCWTPLLSRGLATRAAAGVRIIGGASLAIVALAAGLYGRDYLRLAATGDLARFHRATWYWPAYDWANHETPPDARFVVVLYGGNTYPLDRWNISADPGSSAALPWQAITNSCDLGIFLLDARADFVFYGPNVWTGRAMDASIERTIDASIRAGALDTVRTFDVPIVYSRMRGLERESTVTLYRVDRAAIGRTCPRPAAGSSRR